MSPTAAKTFVFDEIPVRVEATHADIDWLTEFFAPSAVTGDHAATIVLQHVVDSKRYDRLFGACSPGNPLDVFMLDKRILRYPSFEDGKGTSGFLDSKNEILHLLSSDRIVLLSKDRPRKLRSCLMRVIREIVMCAAQLRGGRYLHASAIALEGDAAMITGAKGAGKTSLLTYLLRERTGQKQVSFLANDRLLLKCSESSIRMSGMPTFISVRPGTFKLFPGMEDELIRKRFNPRFTLEECASGVALQPTTWSHGRRGLSQAQFCSLNGCAAVSGAAGKSVIFPVQTGRSGGLSLRNLEAEDVRNRLEVSLFREIHPLRPSAAFSPYARRRTASRILSDGDLFQAMSEKLRGYECLLGNDAYSDSRGADEVFERLNGK